MNFSPAENNLPPVLIDTPIWLTYFRKNEHIFQEVNALMDAGRVCSLSLIIAELLYTAQDKEKLKILQDFTKIFPILQEKEGLWIEAALLTYELRERKKRLSLRDAYLALMAVHHGVLLYTTNKTFLKMPKSVGLKLYKNGEKRRETKKENIP
ncbi:MAG: PIN domain-containing protein [Thermodesulfobacteriota bacterium]